MEEINKLIQNEIEQKVQSKITTFIEHVAVTYDISMRVLLRDFSRLNSGEEASAPPAPSKCLGVCASTKKRCKFSPGPTGYCKKHIDQWKPPPPPMRTPTKVCTIIKHTHAIPTVFDPECPACARSINKRKENLLINI